MIDVIKYKKSMAEVLYLLNTTDKSIITRIPKMIIDNIITNSDKEYFSSLSQKGDNIDIEYSEEAKAMIAVLYRDYLCNELEKEEFNKFMYDKAKKIEIDKKGKYPVDNLFKSKEYPKENAALTEVKEQHIFQKIISKIKNFFRIH